MIYIVYINCISPFWGINPNIPHKTNVSKKCQLLWFLDKVPESPDNTKTQIAEAAQDLQAAREDAEAGTDEHQRGHLGQTPQEEHQAGQ